MQEKGVVYIDSMIRRNDSDAILHCDYARLIEWMQNALRVPQAFNRHPIHSSLPIQAQTKRIAKRVEDSNNEQQYGIDHLV
jgi:hypothetical protein